MGSSLVCPARSSAVNVTVAPNITNNIQWATAPVDPATEASAPVSYRPVPCTSEFPTAPCAPAQSNPDSFSSAVQRPRGRELFRTAVRRIVHLLKLRKRWAAYGKVLQEEPRCLLWEGLVRKKGVLHRVKPRVILGARGKAIAKATANER